MPEAELRSRRAFLQHSLGFGAALLIGGCKGKSPTGPDPTTPGFQPVNITPVNVVLPDGWNNRLPGGSLMFNIHAYSPGKNGTARVGQEFFWRWSIETSFGQVTAIPRKFSSRPEPWNGDPDRLNNLPGETVVNRPNGLVHLASSVAGYPKLSGSPIQTPENISWIRFYLEVSNEGSGIGSMVVAAVDIEHNWNFTT